MDCFAVIPRRPHGGWIKFKKNCIQDGARGNSLCTGRWTATDELVVDLSYLHRHDDPTSSSMLDPQTRSQV